MIRGPSLRNLGTRVRSLNTAPITREEYAGRYRAWGGSFILHPEVLDYLEDAYGIKTSYRGYFKRGQCIGAAGTWGPYIAGDRNALRRYKLTDQVDFGFPVLYLPIAPGHRCTVLYRASYLLSHQMRQIRGSIFTVTKPMFILRSIPDALPSGKRRFQIEERRFERAGGTLRDVKDFGGDEIAAIYEELFFSRWKRKPHAIGALKCTMDRLRQFLFGKILLLKGRPVAVQINFSAETNRTLCVDYINGGVDKSTKGFSPGSLLSYINGREACAQALQGGKQLIYSYGYGHGNSGGDYRDQWCNRVARGFTGFWLP